MCQPMRGPSSSDVAGAKKFQERVMKDHSTSDSSRLELPQNGIGRRDFGRGALASLLTYAVLETCLEEEAFAESVEPITAKWLRDLNDTCRDVHGLTKTPERMRIGQLQWQHKVEQLFAKVELEELLKLVDFEKLKKRVKHREKGETSLRFQFPKVDGMPGRIVLGKQIFALKKGRSVVPHGHNNMATAFFILGGKLRGRHYDRLEDQKKHIIIRPTVNRIFSAGECATVSDYRDNIHWFTAVSDEAFIFNIHVLGLKTPDRFLRTGRVYVDPEGERLQGGLIRAPRAGWSEVKDKYG